MRVAHVTKFYYPDIGGIQKVIRELCQWQRGTDHQADVITLNRPLMDSTRVLPAQETLDGIVVKRIPYWGPRRYAVGPAVLSLVGDYDLVHLHSSDFFLDYLALTQPIHKRPLVLSTHGLFFHTDFAPALKKAYFNTLTRLSLRRVSAISCVSQPDLELLRQIAPERKLHLVPNGVAYDQLSQFPVHERLSHLLVSVGRLAPNKRHDRLLRTFARLARKHPAARLLVIGPDRGLLCSLKRLRDELGVADRVEFTGPISDSALLGHLSRASVWVSAPSYEGFGISLLEAMTAGCVPVVQPIDAFAQLLTDGVEGFYADFDEPEQAARVIAKAMSLAPQERETMIARARAKAAQFSWSRVAQRVQRIYESALGQTQSSATS